MLNDEIRFKVYCQQCGKELPDTAGAVNIGPALCSKCLLSICKTPSYLQTTFNKPPFNMLADEIDYQYSWLHLHNPDVLKISNYEPNMLGSLSDASLSTIIKNVGVLQQSFLNPATLETAPINSIARTITEANLNIADTVSAVIQTENYLERLTDPSYRGWLNPDNITDCSVLSCSVPSLMTNVLGASIVANNAFLSFDPQKLYEIPGVHGDVAELSINSLNELAGEYKLLSADLYGHHDNIMRASSLVTERLPFEIYQAGTLAAFIAPLKEPEVEEGLVKPREIIRLREDIRKKILSLGKPFLKMYDGAVEAINSTSSDSQRHACISLRELITHILNNLAPDEEVIHYLNNFGEVEEHLHEGKPIRPSKIRYICRKIEAGSFSKVIDADVKSTSAFIKLIQEGTHSLEPRFNEEQLTALLSRTEGLISYLIDVSNA